MSDQPRFVPPGDGPLIDAVGDRYRFLAVGAQTGGRYALWHATVMPGGGPPPHAHEREIETFYVLRGQVTFSAAGERTAAGPGASLQMPVGLPHAFKNESAEPAEMLIMVAPAGLEEMFFRTGTPVSDPASPVAPPSREEIERLLRIAPEYGIRLLMGH